MNRFRQIPFLRILLPFIAGILLGLQLEQKIPVLSWLLIGLFALLTVFFVVYTKSRFKTLYLFVCDVLLFVFGMYLVQEHSMQWKPNYYGSYINESRDLRLLARIENVPSEKTKTYKVQLHILEVEQDANIHAAEGHLIAYFKKHSAIQELKAGTLLSLRTRLQKVDASLNPEEFDYKTYLYNRQIYHVAFVDSFNYQLLPESPSGKELKYLALRSKQWIVERLKSAGLSREAYSICSALLTGFDEEIGQDVMSAFAHSGTLHVLSVSGLHTGLIFVFLSFVFDVFDRYRKFKTLKFSLLIFVLWSFALLTGLEAPVLRSVLMLSLFAVGSVFYNNEPKNQLNLLFVSAFGLLCANPFFITEVGFQLSFAAIFGLIVFEPFFSRFWQPESPWKLWIWKSITASFAATLSTLPFTLLYFKQFPIWFFVANLVVVPVSFLLLLLAIPALFHWKVVVLCINWLTAFLIKFIGLFNWSSWTYLDGFNFKMEDAFWLTALITFISLALYKRSFRQLQYTLLLFIVWQLSGLIRDVKVMNKQFIAVYAVNKTCAYAAKDGGILFYSFSDSGATQRYLKPHAVALGNPRLKERRFNCVETRNSQVLFLHQKGALPAAETQKATYLVVSNNHLLNEEEIKLFRPVKAVVLDHSIPRKNREGMEKLCRKFGLLCYDTRKQGAFILSQDEIENWR
ncbi:MAG: ComEC/Rec2 family competence protein [Bacteroidia bacterium]|nr:ComEC/Rec2 family competence protein [Bacteroidia bacterium]